jgi:hypothetical protein
MGQELIVPDSFKNFKPPTAMATLDPAADNLSSGIGQAYGVLGYKGKTWSLRVHGDRHNFIRKDDGTPAPYLDVIILGQAQQKSKSYYEKYDPNAEGGRPICASLDGLVPDDDVAQKQAATCALCPRNEWKTHATTGRKGKECQDYKRLAVVVMPYLTAPILGTPLIEPVFLRVPPASLTSLAVMGDTMSQRGLHFSTYVTRISFDPNEATPKMVFKPLQGVTEAEAPVILELMADPTVKRITGGDLVLSGPKQVTQQTAPATPPSTPAAPTATLVSPAPPAAPSPSNSLGSAQPVTEAVVVTEASPPAPASTPETKATIGFGGATSLAAAREASLQPSEPKPAQQSVTDTGEPEASDIDLDAKIAGLLKTN